MAASVRKATIFLRPVTDGHARSRTYWQGPPRRAAGRSLSTVGFDLIGGRVATGTVLASDGRIIAAVFVETN